MKELLKNQYKNVILVCCYIIVTTLVYTVCADCIFDSIWYLDVIVGVVVAALGCYIGYKYIKSEEAIRIKKLEDEEKANEESAKENEATDNEVETVEDKEEKTEENSIEE